jgi:hypothetical protein
MPSTPILTVFTTPKPFSDPHISVIQHNAIQSWIHLGPQVEVLLVGDEPGMAEAAAVFGIQYLRQVECNQAGTPLVSSIFALARQASRNALMTFVNADVMLLPDILEAAHLVSEKLTQFVLLGQRWDLDVRQRLDFSGGWADRLRAETQARGRLHLPAGSDYFLFPKALFTDMPDFAIGRAGWDNWMIYHARQQGWPVVDATPSVMAIHQDHDYSHLPGGRPHYEQPESRRNEALAGGSANLYMVLDSDKELVNGRIRRPRWTLLRTLRRAEVWLTPPDGTRQGLRWSLARQMRRTRRRITGSL